MPHGTDLLTVGLSFVTTTLIHTVRDPHIGPWPVTLSSFIVPCNDRYAHDCKDHRLYTCKEGAAVIRWRRPWMLVPRLNSVALCGFCGQKIWQQRISTKKCCPCTVNIACHIKQSSKTTSFGGTLSWRCCGMSSVRACSDSNHKNFTPQVSRDLWNGGTSA